MSGWRPRGHHRAAAVIGLLTAPVAYTSRARWVLHYDADFEHFAVAAGKPHEWIVPRGTLD